MCSGPLPGPIHGGMQSLADAAERVPQTPEAREKLDHAHTVIDSHNPNPAVRKTAANPEAHPKGPKNVSARQSKARAQANSRSIGTPGGAGQAHHDRVVRNEKLNIPT